MQKKEYFTPELNELGMFADFTKNSWIGLNTDGNFPDHGPEMFGS